MPQHFAFRFDPGYQRASRLFGVRPDTTSITVDEGLLLVRFGPWRVTTALDNVRHVTVTGPYARLKTMGPARLGLTDRGLTFATNGERGVCLDFVTPVTGIDPLGVVRHPNLTLTADNCDALRAALRPAP